MEEEIISHRHATFTFLFLLVINIVLLTAHLTNYVQGLKNFLFYIVAPSSTAASRVFTSTHNVFHSLSEIVRIHQDNLELRKKLQRYSYLESAFKQTQDENNRLRQIVGFERPQGYSAVAVNVIVREPESWFQWVIIDKGSAEGIRTDAPVLAWVDDRAAVLGRTAEVYKHTTKVILLSNILSAIPAQTTPSNEDGLIEGQNNHKLSINYLITDSKAQIGDEVVTSQLSTVFPPGLLIGRIQDIIAGNDAFRSAQVKPALSFNNLKTAVVLVPRGHAAAQDDQEEQ